MRWALQYRDTWAEIGSVPGYVIAMFAAAQARTSAQFSAQFGAILLTHHLLPLQELNQSNYINIWLAMAVTYNLMNLGMNIIRMWKPTAPLALMVGNVVFDLVKWLVLAFMFVLIPFSIGMDVLYGADGIESCQEDQGVPAGEGNWRVLSALLFLFQTMVNAEGAYGCLWKSEPSMGDIELANGLAGVVLLVVFHAIVVFLLITMLVRRSPAQLWRNYGAILRAIL